MIGLLAVICSGNGLRPTRDLTAAAAKMALGEWNARVDPYGAGDIRYLARKMNQLASQAEINWKNWAGNAAIFAALVDTLPDPILATDSTGACAAD